MSDILDHEDVEIKRSGPYHLLCVKDEIFFTALSRDALLSEERLETIERIVEMSAPALPAPEPF